MSEDNERYLECLRSIVREAIEIYGQLYLKCPEARTVVFGPFYIEDDNDNKKFSESKFLDVHVFIMRRDVREFKKFIALKLMLNGIKNLKMSSESVNGFRRLRRVTFLRKRVGLLAYIKSLKKH